MALVSRELTSFLESGIIMYLATRSETLVPESVLAVGARAQPDSDRLTVFVADCLAAATVANVRHNGQMALTVARPTDHRSLQLKGTLIQARPASQDDQAFQLQHVQRLGPEMALVGVPPSVSQRFVWWPSVALEMRVEDIFVQTPGPGAGRRLGEGEPAR